MLIRRDHVPVFSPFAALGLGQALEEAAGVGRGAQQVRGFLEGVVVGAGDEYGVTAPGVDLDRDPVVVLFAASRC